MRLQLTALATAALVAVGSTASASVPARTTARVDVYTDDWITVVSPAAGGEVELPGGVKVDAAYAVDVLSGATFAMNADAISSATTFAEERHEASGGVSLEVAPYTTMSATYFLSLEPDYVTHAVAAGFSAEVLDRMATLSLTYTLNVEEIGVAHDDAFSEDLLGHALDVSWTQILGPRTVLTVLATASVSYCGDLIGCHSSPYRYVGVYAGGGESKDLIALPERHPSQRVRGAGAARLAHNLGHGVALAGGYRLYGDSWAIVGHTVDASVSWGVLAERLVLRGEGRFTWQSGASFYRDRYDTTAGGPPAFRTGDREMSDLWDAMAGLRVETTFDVGKVLRQVTMNLRVAHLWYRYPGYSELPSREAWLVGFGATAAF